MKKHESKNINWSKIMDDADFIGVVTSKKLVFTGFDQTLTYEKAIEEFKKMLASSIVALSDQYNKDTKDIIDDIFD